MREDVDRLLQSHVPFDLTENEHRRSMLALLESKGDPFARDRFDPGHFTASAFVLSPERDALLLVMHSKLRRWLQPGGHIERTDRSVESAARREVLEETGLDGLLRFGDTLLDVDVHDIPGRPSEPPHRHHDLRMLFVAPHRGVAAGGGVEAVRFVPFDELDHVTTDDSVRRAVEKIQARLRMARQAEA